MHYIAYLLKDSQSDFGVSFSDFPGCVTVGKSLDEARRKAPEVLAFHIAGVMEDGEKIPKPSKIDDLAGNPDRQNAVAFLVTAEFKKAKTMRVNITARKKPKTDAAPPIGEKLVTLREAAEVLRLNPRTVREYV